MKKDGEQVDIAAIDKEINNVLQLMDKSTIRKLNYCFNKDGFIKTGCVKDGCVFRKEKFKDNEISIINKIITDNIHKIRATIDKQVHEKPATEGEAHGGSIRIKTHRNKHKQKHNHTKKRKRKYKVKKTRRITKIKVKENKTR